MNEKPVQFTCGTETLIGILSSPETNKKKHTGIVISIGGPQYRVGSHRQFVTMARALAYSGYYVFRFDYRGMGDSSGKPISFEAAGPDIAAAISALLDEEPFLTEIILLGLCDAASINLIYANTDPRIKGLVLLNPWVRTDSGKAESELRHYYTKRFLEKEFWEKIFSNKVDVRNAVFEIISKLWKVIYGRIGRLFLQKNDPAISLSLPQRMEASFLQFSGRMLLIISGNDLVAAEFMDRVSSSGKWMNKLNSNSVRLVKMTDADHTFSTQQWKDQLVSHIQYWLCS